ncbi:MAG: hypothetical protein ACOY46_17285 [Bacillota bacterium]
MYDYPYKPCPPSPGCPEINDTFSCKLNVLKGQQATAYVAGLGAVLTGMLNDVGADFIEMMTDTMRMVYIPVLSLSAVTPGGPIAAGAGPVAVIPPLAQFPGGQIDP